MDNEKHDQRVDVHIALKTTPMPVDEFRKSICEFEEHFKKLPCAFDGSEYPLKHSFGKGCYVREINVPAGNMVITKIHKHDHPCFVLKGECSVFTEDGLKRIKAPTYFITPAGTKRVVYVHKDTVWVTVHVTNETDLEKIEDEIIAKSFEEFSLSEEQKKAIEEVA